MRKTPQAEPTVEAAGRQIRNATILARLMAPSFMHMQMLQGISGIATLYAIFWADASAMWWVGTIVAYFCTGCLGLTVTLHRALTHRAVTFPAPIEYLFTWFGIAGGTGSSIAWTAMHRAHHAHVDSARDPHAPEKLGVSILFSVYDYDFNPRHAADLLRDPVHRFFHRYYAVLLAAWAIGLYAINPLACLFLFLVPAFVQITVSNLTSILTHSHGYRSFQTKDKSANNWLIAVLAWGEGWHNNHHASPNRPLFQYRWWEVDPGGLCILGMTRIGLGQVKV
jgi:stearoyl-CoA desaturase (delta-9 desaturase)